MSEALEQLREARASLMRPGAPMMVNLRDYVPEGSAAWRAFVREWPADTGSDPPEGSAAWQAFVRAWRVPGDDVRRATVVGWIEDVIARLEAETDAREKPADEPAGKAEAPSPRDLPRAGERSSTMEGAVFGLETDDIARALAQRAATGEDAGPATDWPVAATVPVRGMDDWYYGPEDDEAARAERASLSAAQWEERLRWQAEQQAGRPAPAPDAPEPSAGAPSSSGTPLRRLTAEGIAEAQAFLTRLREQPDADRTPSRELLFGPRYSRPFEAGAGITVERRAFRTRREAGAYLSPLLAPVRHRITDDAGVWSWLGMFYFPDIVRVKDGQVLLHADTTSLFLGERSAQRRYRHYLWSAWRLYEQHGESVAYVLDQPLTDSGDIAKAVLDYPRVFTSTGVIQLILQLYTDGQRTKRGFSVRARANASAKPRPGNVWHLIERALPQLELTYDVYGMGPDALLEVLPDAFRRWKRTGAD